MKEKEIIIVNITPTWKVLPKYSWNVLPEKLTMFTVFDFQNPTAQTVI